MMFMWMSAECALHAEGCQLGAPRQLHDVSGTQLAAPQQQPLQLRQQVHSWCCCWCHAGSMLVLLLLHIVAVSCACRGQSLPAAEIVAAAAATSDTSDTGDASGGGGRDACAAAAHQTCVQLHLHVDQVQRPQVPEAAAGQWQDYGGRLLRGLSSCHIQWLVWDVVDVQLGNIAAVCMEVWHKVLPCILVLQVQVELLGGSSSCCSPGTTHQGTLGEPLLQWHVVHDAQDSCLGQLG